MCSIYKKKKGIYFIFIKGGWLKVEWDMDLIIIYYYRYGFNWIEKDKYDVKVCDELRLLEN